MKSISALISVLFSFLILVSCGGSGGGSSTGNESGFVTLSVGDNAIDEFDQAIFDISAITLIGDAGHVVVLDELRTIDFLALESINEVLAETAVPAGSYSKIRLQVDAIDLVELDEQGQVLRSESVRLVANGKVDVVPRGEFHVDAGATLALDIDFDLDKSIKLTSTGQGRYIFRPVIFADVISSAEAGGLVRIEGEFEAVEAEAVLLDNRFKVCDEELLSDDDNVSESPECRLVLIDPEVAVFAVEGQTLVASALANFANGDNVVVYGFLAPEAYQHDSADHYGTPINAMVVAAGQFQRFEGLTASSFDGASEIFDIELAEGQGIVGDLLLPTHLPLTQGALLIDRDGSRLLAEALVVDLDVEVEGLLTLGAPNNFDAFIAILDAQDAIVTVMGMATAIDLINQQLTLTDGADTYCVVIDELTDIQQLENIGDTVSVGAISISALLSANIEVSGTEVDDCIVAQTIVLDTTAVL